MAQQIGTVKTLEGKASATNSQGAQRDLKQSDAVFLDDTVENQDLGQFVIRLNDGAEMELFRDLPVTLDAALIKSMAGAPLEVPPNAPMLSKFTPPSEQDVMAARAEEIRTPFRHVGKIAKLDGAAVASIAGGEDRELQEGDPVFPGETVINKAGEEVIVALDDGSELNIGPEGFGKIPMTDVLLAKASVLPTDLTAEGILALTAIDPPAGQGATGNDDAGFAPPPIVESTNHHVFPDAGHETEGVAVQFDAPRTELLQAANPTASIIGVDLGQGPGTAVEGDPVVFEVRLDQPSTADTVITVVVSSKPADTATQGEDYSSTTTYTVTIPAGETTGRITVDTIDDNIDEPSQETFTAEIVSVDNANTPINLDSTPATGTILDNDVLNLTITGGEAIEGQPVQFTVSQGIISTQDTEVLVTVFTGPNDTATQGVDYDGTATYTVTIPAGQTSATFTVDTIEDELFEGNETFSATVTAAENANGLADIDPTPATGTIVDNDTPTASITGIDGGSALEGTPVTFEVGIDKVSTVDTIITVDVFSGPNDTATQGVDYDATTTYTVIIPAGQTTASFTVDTIDDDLFEGNETFSAKISAVDSANGTVNIDETPATGTILDNDTPTASITGIDGGSALEGTPVTFEVGIDKVSTVDTVLTVDVFSGPNDTATQGVDYDATTTYTVTIPAGQTTATFTVDTIDDDLFEGNETFSAKISAVDSANGTVNIDETPATGTIIDNDTPTVSVSGINGGTAEEGNPVTFEVSIDKASTVDTTVVVNVFSGPNDTATQGADYDATTSYTVIIPAGQTSATFTVDTIDDNLREGDETFSAQIASVDNANGAINLDATPATGTILDNEPVPVVSIAPPALSVDEAGNTFAEFTVNLSGPTNEDIVVSWSTAGQSATAGADYGTQGGGELSGQVTIPAGTTTGSTTIRIPIIDDTLVEGDETFAVNLDSVDSGVATISDTAKTGVATIIEDDVHPQPGAGQSTAEVTEAALDDGPGGDDDGTQNDPAQATGIGTTDSGSLVVENGTISAISVQSGPGGGATTQDLGDRFELTANDGSWKVTVDKASGDFNFELLDNVDHPQGDNLAYDEGSLNLEFAYTVTGPGGSADGGLQVTIRDDRPEGGDQRISVDEAMPVSTNLVIAFDRSGSMGADPDGRGGFDTRLDLARAAVKNLLNAYEALGEVNVLVVDFATSADSSGWMSVSDAAQYLDSLAAGGLTNYTDALAETASAYPNGLPSADQSFVYFLSDGRPNVGIPDASEVAAWEQFLTNNGIEKSFAVGVGQGVAAADEDLQDVAFPNNDPNNPIIVLNESELSSTLVGTVPSVVDGNLFDGAGAANFGADGPGHIVSVVVDGITYVFDPATRKITASTGDVTDGEQLSVTTQLGGALSINFSDGDYSYTPPAVDGDQQEVIQYNLVDGDGDGASGSLTIDVIDKGAPAPITSTSTAEVAEAALNDGPGGDDDGSQNDPALAAGVGTTASASLTVDNGAISAVNVLSGPGGGATTQDLGNAFELTANDGSWKLTVNKTTGDYDFELLDNVSHPDGDNLAFDDGGAELQFSYTVTGPGGSADGALNVTIRDDRPEATDQTVSVNEASAITTNLVITFDRSGSMNENPDGRGGFDSRLDLARAAVNNLMNAYAALGVVNVLIVDFATSADNSGWLSLGEAKQYLDGLNARGLTNYTDALDETASAFPNGLPSADQSFVYFLSDGKPNIGVPNSAEVSAWEQFLTDSGIEKAFAVGVGRGVSAADDDLRDVAFPNNDADNPIIVLNESELSSTLVGTVPSVVDGNVFDGASGATFGADGAGHIASVTVDGVTYTYDPTTQKLTASTGEIIDGAVLAITTNLGGALTFDFGTGAYQYSPPVVDADQQEVIEYTLVDSDGDGSTGNLTINVKDVAVNSVPDTPPLGDKDDKCDDDDKGKNNHEPHDKHVKHNASTGIHDHRDDKHDKHQKHDKKDKDDDCDDHGENQVAAKASSVNPADYYYSQDGNSSSSHDKGSNGKGADHNSGGGILVQDPWGQKGSGGDPDDQGNVVQLPAPAAAADKAANSAVTLTVNQMFTPDDGGNSLFPADHKPSHAGAPASGHGAGLSTGAAHANHAADAAMQKLDQPVHVDAS